MPSLQIPMTKALGFITGGYLDEVRFFNSWTKHTACYTW